jgi:hypothetical protein
MDIIDSRFRWNENTTILCGVFSSENEYHYGHCSLSIVKS